MKFFGGGIKTNNFYLLKLTNAGVFDKLGWLQKLTNKLIIFVIDDNK